jgi:methylenetetrahydrofolate--tRNA-(uracil-5-)-methyltransferase
MTSGHQIHIIGGGMAGCEAAWQLGRRGIRVLLSEMRGNAAGDTTAAHQGNGLAELVCSNSFRSDDADSNAVGLLHQEMRSLDSVIMAAAEVAKVPAGSALAVDRDIFSNEIARLLASNDNITISRERVDAIPNDLPVIIATGPLTHGALAQSIIDITGQDRLAFFDAIAPIVYHESIDMNVAWYQSRWDKGDGKDYINCPMDEEQYRRFHQGLIDSDKAEFKDWEQETPYFEGCMPIEVMASRGLDTLRFGPMKPVGLTNPNTAKRAHAVVQLRQDNKQGSLWNIVGFQTKMKHGAQIDLLRQIPGLENAEFARLGGLHRNTFIRSPVLLDRNLRLKSHPNVRFAGQITGCEGYVESAAVGLIAGIMAAGGFAEQEIAPPPATTALGALLAHITGDAAADSYQPMNVNFGLFAPMLGKVHKKERKAALTNRARSDLSRWMHEQNIAC